MTPADIIRMAREAWGDLACSMQDEPIQFFANTVAAAAEAAEREACAKVCNSMFDLRGANDDHKYMADKCAEAIRARSQQPGVTS